MAQKIAKEKGYSDVLYLDAVHKKYLEEVSSCNIFVVKVRHRCHCQLCLLFWIKTSSYVKVMLFSSKSYYYGDHRSF
jgi:branched-subunit amino acid aminotransferase/4-amino-4-deoxychorismate lyase